ncbi:MAG: hypothetical protein B7Y51_11365 [Burkholderiales bacterium 28-67-8]|nr:MAG: hypothetical protein B7Y51_11365 [Burkholderiales bacterium 28-67-8]
MDHTTRIALLIDADNVSVDVLREVIHRLQASGDRLQHRRAYGSVQKAGEFAEVCRDHAIRFLPSTFAGPNATDIAMAIDAIELVLRQPVDEVVIVSSDMDYSPLIVRLRELGCRVTGYGQQGKSGRDIERDYERVYDQFSVIGPAKPRAAAKRAPAVEVRADESASPRPSARAKAPRAPRVAKAQKLAVPVSVPVPAQVPEVPVAVPRPEAVPAAPAPQAAAPTRSRTRRPAAKSAEPAPAHAAMALPAAVEAVLEACPGLRGGALVRLNGVAKALRDGGLLSQSGRTTSLFKKLQSHFEVVPADKPESVRFLGV